MLENKQIKTKTLKYYIAVKNGIILPSFSIEKNKMKYYINIQKYKYTLDTYLTTNGKKDNTKLTENLKQNIIYLIKNLHDNYSILHGNINRNNIVLNSENDVRLNIFDSKYTCYIKDLDKLDIEKYSNFWSPESYGYTIKSIQDIIDYETYNMFKV